MGPPVWQRFCSLVLLAPATVAAQTPPATQPAGADLEPRVTVIKSLATPDDPLWIQFTLSNLSDQAVEIEVPAGDDGVGLPRGLVLGPSDAPSLTISFNGEKAEPVPGVAALAQPTQTLRIAPRAVIGVTLNLRDLWRQARYIGEYRVEWRPLAGRLGCGAASLRVEPRKLAILVTDYGKVTFKLAYDRAPRNVENFLELVRGGFYNGKTIHRIIPDFALQGGSPTGDSTGTRPDGKLVPAELSPEPFDLGTLAMARKPDELNSASCQFFVTLARISELDGLYTIIGHASDDESQRTLRRLATVATDNKQRPVHALYIRSISLVDDEIPAAARRSAAQP